MRWLLKLVLLSLLAAPAWADVAARGLATGGTAEDTTSDTFSLGSVTSGDTCIVWGMFYSPSADVPAAGDLTRSSGATIGTVSLLVQDGGSTGTGAFAYTAIWAFSPTSSGALSMTLGGRPAGSYFVRASECFTGIDAEEDPDNGGVNTGNAITSHTSGNVTLAAGGIILGGLALNTGNNTAITPDGAFTTVFEAEDGTTTAVGSAIYRINAGPTGLTDSADWTFTALSGAAGDGASASAQAMSETADGGGGSALPKIYQQMAVNDDDYDARRVIGWR